MSNTEKHIKGTGVICKGNVTGNFELLPMDLFNYVQLELITHTDLVVYVKLLQLYRDEYGYAFPTIQQLMNFTRVGSKATIHNSLNALGDVGLLHKSKTKNGNNVYVVYKPLSKDELYKIFPKKVEKLKEFEAKLFNIAEQDKERLMQHQINKQNQEQLESGIQAKQILPNVVTENIEEKENLSLKELKMLMKKNGEW